MPPSSAPDLAHADLANPASRSARASSTERIITMLDAPFAKATAAVVKARNTSMTATVPVARSAPSKRLWIDISIAHIRS
jgi:hypothetical protein